MLKFRWEFPNSDHDESLHAKKHPKKFSTLKYFNIQSNPKSFSIFVHAKGGIRIRSCCPKPHTPRGVHADRLGSGTRLRTLQRPQRLQSLSPHCHFDARICMTRSCRPQISVLGAPYPFSILLQYFHGKFLSNARRSQRWRGKPKLSP